MIEEMEKPQTMRDLREALSDAEKAEEELARKSALSIKAPELRKKLQQFQRQGNARADRDMAMTQARKAAEELKELQRGVPEDIKKAAAACHLAYIRLTQVRQARDRALAALGEVDYCDFLIGIEELRAKGDSRLKESDINIMVAAEHGQHRVRQLFDELMPDFDFLSGINHSDVVTREVSQFLLNKAAPPIFIPGLYSK